eukprot:CAMPEP_0171683646 /NCGR_PEP_ID=MMETSP0991-20121206/1226_1 /TAXON_ID=483369 /ORGANISM="non described non described, Strain CCMP2098" /LENGTH=32 /DNA_ID= /DNA_START= /DNA_END= /DNA_ORIENTATION=
MESSRTDSSRKNWREGITPTTTNSSAVEDEGA